MNYIINLNCRVDAKTAEEARTKALTEIQVREAKPMVLLPLTVFERLKDFRDKQKEHFIVLLLNTQSEIIRQQIVSIGTLNASLVHSREVYRLAIAEGCAAIIVAHNHPSGSLVPSAEDLNITKRLADCGKLLGVELLDHVILTTNAYYSFRQHNLI